MRRGLLILIAGIIVGVGGCAGKESATPGDLGSMRFADLESAAEAARRCIADEGYEATTDYAADIYVHGFDAAGDGPGVDRAIARCIDEHYQSVADHWQALHADDIDARNRAVEQRIVECLHDAGYEFDELDGATRDAIDRRDPSARADCLAASSEPASGG